MSNDMENLEKELVKTLFNLGINGARAGYLYVKAAITIKIHFPSIVDAEMYRIIADRYDTTPRRVKNNISLALEQAGNLGALLNLNKLYGATVIHKKLSPTNFINKVAQYLINF